MRDAVAAAPLAGTPRAGLFNRIKEAATHTAVYGVGSVLQTALQFALIPLYTRYFTADMYGVLTLVTLAATLAAMVFYFGASSALARSYYDYEAEGDRRIVISTAFYITVVGAIAQVVLGFIIRDRLSLALFGSTVYGPHLVVAFVGAAATFVNNLLYLVLRFERRSVFVVGANAISLAATAVLIWVLLVDYRFGVMAPLLGIALSQLALGSALVWTLWRVLVPAVSRHELLTQLKLGSQIVLVAVAYYVLDSLDRLIIARYCPVEDVGVYSLGYKIGMVIHALFIIPFAQIWAPMRMQYRHEAQAAELNTLVLTYYFVIGLMAALAISLFSRELLTMIGGHPEYLAAYRVVPYIVFGHLFYGAMNIVDAGIFFERRMMYHAYAYWSVVALNTALNLVLVPRLGYMAAAYSTLACYVVLVIVVFVVANRLHPFEVEGRRLAVAFTSGIAVLLAGTVAGRLAPLPATLAKVAMLGTLAAFWYGFLMTDRERGRLQRLAWRVE